MKSNRIFTILLTMIGLVITQFSANAQLTGNGNINAKVYELSSFTGIEAGGAFKVTLIQSGTNSVVIESDENLFAEISAEVRNGVLRLSSRNIRKATKLEAMVSFVSLQSVEASGAAVFNSDGPMNVADFSLKASGASVVRLNLFADAVKSEISGASKVYLTGAAQKHTVALSGAAKLFAGDFETTVTNADASGASDALINAKDELNSKTSGAAKIRYDQNPARINKKDTSVTGSTGKVSSEGADSVSVTVGNIKIKVVDGDTTVVMIGDRKLSVDEKGNVSLTRKKKHKFNGHWAGVELGINGYLTPDYDMAFAAGNEFLDLRMEKSIAVNLNFYEQNFKLNQRGTFGLVSGLGITWNNYRFANDVTVRNEQNQFKGYYMEDVNVRKSKLVNTWLTLPLYLEVQTPSSKRKERAHFAAGVVAGWRFSSHTKIYFNESNQPYRLRSAETGVLSPEIMRTPASNRRNIVKEHNSFQQSPFKLDASVRAGWGVVNLFANYSLTPMFTKNRGPELYPFAVGITLNSF